MNDNLPEVKPDIGSALVTINDMINGFLAQLPNLVIATVVVTIAYFVAKTVRRLVRRTTARGRHPNVGLVVGRLAQWGVFVIGLLIALTIAAPSVKPVNILSALGVGSIAIGFAFKDVLQNFLAGILILLRQPFRVGDQIVFDDYEGTVEDIDARATKLKTYDGRRVVIPNGELYTKSVTVNTAYPMRRSEYQVGVGYGDDVARAEEVILEAVQGVQGVMSNPAPDAFAWDFAESSVNIKVRWWTKSIRGEVVAVRGRVIRAIKQAVDDAQINIAYPTRVVLFHDQTEEGDGDRKRQREGWPAGEDPPKPKRQVDGELRDALIALGDIAKRSGDDHSDEDRGRSRARAQLR